MWLVEFSLTHRIPVACFSCHKNNKISISWLNYNRKQEILLKNLLQNQQNLKADGIYSCTGIYFFKSAFIFFNFDFLNQSQWQEKGVNGNLLFSKRNLAHLLKARDSIPDEIFHSILL